MDNDNGEKRAGAVPRRCVGERGLKAEPGRQPRREATWEQTRWRRPAPWRWSPFAPSCSHLAHGAMSAKVSLPRRGSRTYRPYSALRPARTALAPPRPRVISARCSPPDLEPSGRHAWCRRAFPAHAAARERCPAYVRSLIRGPCPSPACSGQLAWASVIF